MTPKESGASHVNFPTLNRLLAPPLHSSKRLTLFQVTVLRRPMKLPRQFYAPLAIGAPAPLRDLPVRLERMIHFVPPHIEKVRAKVPELVRQVDVVLGNLEDAIPVDAKTAARDGFIAMARA